MILLAIQLILFSRLGADASFWNLLPALLIGGVGMALHDDAERGSGDAERAGRQGRRRLGRAQLRAPGRRDDGNRDHGRDRGRARRAAGRRVDAFMDGFQAALTVAAGIAIVGAVVAFVLVRPHEGAGERAGPPAAAEPAA